MAEPTDFELMERIQSRDRRALFLLKDRYRKRLFEIAYAVLKNPHRSEETTRQVFEFCWRKAEVFDLERDRSVAQWLYELTGHYARESSRRWPWEHQQTQERMPLSRNPLSAWIIGILCLTLFGLGASFLNLIWRNRSLEDQISLQGLASADVIRQIHREWQQRSSTRSLLLTDPDAQTDALAQVLWSPSEKQAILLTTNLPPAPRGRVYQLWASSSFDTSLPGAQLESAGIFIPPRDGSVQWLSEPLSLEVPGRFIVTLEPSGGSEYPTGETYLESELAAPIPAAVQFSDIQSYWAAQYIVRLAERGIISGFPDGTFSPDEEVTRAQFASIVANAFGLSTDVTPPPFQDPLPSWAASAISASTSAGFISGFPDGTFRPNEVLTRAQAITILTKAATSEVVAPDQVERILAHYRDADRIPQFARQPIATATQKGLLVLYPLSDQIDPNAIASRGDVSALTYQALAKVNRVPPLPPPVGATIPKGVEVQALLTWFLATLLEREFKIGRESESHAQSGS